MPYATCNDISIYYEREGAGDPLLFISGSGGDLRNKPNQFDSPLAQHYELIGYDQRGLGRTDVAEREFTMAQYADDAAALLDYLQLDSVPVMGVSFGGMVAQEFAIRHPDRVTKLVLACTSSGGTGGASYPLHELAVLEAREKAQRQLRIADVRRNDEWIAANPERWEELLALATAGTRAAPSEGALRQLEARRWHDTYDRLDTLSMPVLLAGGEFDGIAPPENMRALRAQIPRSELVFFAGGHLFLVQDKAAYPYIIQWLESH